MNVTQFYETIILRDLLEYLLPGALFLSSTGFVLECFARRVGLSIIGAISNIGIGLFVLFLLAFSIGHLLSGISSNLFRRIDKEQAVKVIKRNPWLGIQTSRAISHYLAIPESEAMELLKDVRAAETLREMGRDFIQVKIPALHREHIGRLSIISRLCRNMSIALISVQVSIILAVIITWDDLQVINQMAPLTLPFAGVFILIVTVLLIIMFMNRSVRLRYRMIQLTFQIWCVSFYMESKRTQESISQDSANSIPRIVDIG
jgi:hypothetical protein